MEKAKKAQLRVDLEISQDVQKLAKNVFDPVEYNEVQKIAKAFLGSRKEKRMTTSRLQFVVPSRPKRPLYYVIDELKFLPKRSRWVVEEMGSYLDLLVKELRYEREGQYRKTSMRKNISALMSHKNDDIKSLLQSLMIFNEYIYVPSKHIYGPPNDPRHYFNSQETAIIVLIAVKLGEELKKKSKYVRNLCQDLVLPAQKPIIGNWKRTDRNGEPFDFKRKLIESGKAFV